ncbi:MAG: carbon starvation protein A [Candidatus Latescibacterota bacterium]|nr:MAG: carbon starvation protein A [Candidatus Latescibacterota bacterium]
MSSLAVAAAALAVLFLGYRFYGHVIQRLFEVDPQRKTPAHTEYDGRDYIPAKNWLILFGHHFASIAGAGPILGPVIAGMVWGWGPAILWIVGGSILLGGVHDFSALMVSIRHKGKSIADVAETTMGKTPRLIFSSLIWIVLVLVVAVFAAAAAKTLSTTPQVVIPTFGLILVAILVGVMVYKLKFNLVLSTAVGIGLLFGLILLGYYHPVNASFHFWLYVLFAYAFIASVLPVNILLQPRDYLAAFVLFFGLLVGYIGLLLTHPAVHTPLVVSFSGTKGPLWPMMCVIIACGAISGFHSLVSGGTTSKQLPNEADAKKIGYGGMITEAALAVLALVSVTAGLYWKGGPAGLVYPELMKGGNWIATFGKGYGQITKPIFGALGMLIGITMLKTFILTTLDSATRITRYIGNELFGERLRIRAMHNPYFNTAVVVAVALYFALGSWQTIWPVFGAANQLIAALVLLVVSTYLVTTRKNVWYCLIPGIFMLLTTTAALIWEVSRFFPQGKILLGTVGSVLLLLAGIVVSNALKILFKKPVAHEATG